MHSAHPWKHTSFSTSAFHASKQGLDARFYFNVPYRQLCLPSFLQFWDTGIWPGPTISLHRMCFPGNFSWWSQQQPKAPGLSADILCSPGPWGGRHHLPSQHIPLWLLCILWWHQQHKGAAEPSWARPTLVSHPHHGSWPWQDSFGWTCKANSWIGIVQWKRINKNALFQEVAPNLVRVKLGNKYQRNLCSPMLRKKRLDQNFFVPAYPWLSHAGFLGFALLCCTVAHEARLIMNVV